MRILSLLFCGAVQDFVIVQSQMAHLDLESEGVEERSTRLCNSPDHGSMLITAVESRLKLALIYHICANAQKVI